MMLHSRDMPGMAFWTPWAALGFALVACDDTSSTDAAPPDAGDLEADVAPPTPDAAPPACEDLATEGDLVLIRCDDGRRFGLRRGDEVLFDRGAVGLDLLGFVLSSDYPQSVWLGTASGVEARFFGRDDVPEIELRLTLAPATLLVESRLVDAAPLAVERFIALDGGAGTTDFVSRLHELSLPGLFIGGLDVDGREIRLEGDAGTLTVASAERSFELLGDVELPSVVLRVGDDPASLRQAHASALAIRADRSRPPPLAPWGWIGDASGARDVLAQLRLHPLTTELPTPLLVVETPIDVSPARLGIRWAPYSGDRDPRRPADRDAVRREADALVEQGAQALWLDFGQGDSPGDPLRAAVAALPEVTRVAVSRGRALLGLVGAGAVVSQSFEAKEQAARLAAWWHYAPQLLPPWLGPVVDRRSAVVVALGGGPFMLMGSARELTPTALDARLQPLVDGPYGPGRPLDDEDPPARWQSETVDVWFNWGDTARTFDDGTVVPADDVVVRPRDAR